MTRILALPHGAADTEPMPLSKFNSLNADEWVKNLLNVWRCYWAHSRSSTSMRNKKFYVNLCDRHLVQTFQVLQSLPKHLNLPVHINLTTIRMYNFTNFRYLFLKYSMSRRIGNH